MLESSFKYRKYEPGDEIGIVNLLKKTFPNWSKRSVGYWKWKYLDPPSDVCTYVAVNGDQIIGVICDIVLKLKLDEKIVNYIYGDDTATDPEYRGRGVYTNLYKFVLSDRINYGTYFNLWMTENPTLLRSALKYGELPFPFSVCHMVKIYNLKKYLKKRRINTLQNRIGFLLLKSVNSLSNSLSKFNASNSTISISTVEKFDEGIDEFWNHIKDEYSYILRKDKDILNWRYCLDNSDEYLIRQATKDNDILGFSVLRYMKNKDGFDGSIMELMALKEHTNVVESLIEDALKQFEQFGVNSINYQVIQGHAYQKLLLKRGFIDVSKAIKNLIYYYTNDPDFDHNVFSEKDPNEIYFNLY